MSGLGWSRAGRAAVMRRPRLTISILLAGMLVGPLAGACDYPFDPFQQNTIGPFTIFGTLDLSADTQWIRVMPIRHEIFAGPEPIDATVTLENVGTGQVATLHDSLFSFADQGLNTSGYAHNFWTDEPLEPGASYRLTATRSDGEATTADVRMPMEPGIYLDYGTTDHQGGKLLNWVYLQTDHVVYLDVVYSVWNTVRHHSDDPVPARQQLHYAAPGVRGYLIPHDTLRRQPPYHDMRRLQVRFVVADSSGWPYVPGLSATQIAVPGKLPTNVKNGFGFVGGIATRNFPVLTCAVVTPHPNGVQQCVADLRDSTTSVVGHVVRPDCTTYRELPDIFLTEKFADGAVYFYQWKASWAGDYRFDGLEPGTDLVLQFPDNPDATMQLPVLGPGEQYEVPDVALPSGCTSRTNP
jgi:hypothetical protein